MEKVPLVKIFLNLGKLYQAFDKVLNIDVALKEEKADKHKKILKFEYEILKDLQGNIIYFTEFYLKCFSEYFQNYFNKEI